ncbi:MAG TPA: TlpA disulfide reductase family protein [Gemmataceae bacterium]|nr:TlpA disulfide reductase family protein [Gemmataceae bacterium]
MPELINLYETHKEHRDQFEILAFHDATAKTFAELDPKLEGPKKTYWHGKDLPFPILLDSTGETLKTYEIRAFPTTILIDPEGKLVGESGEAELESKLPPLPIAVRLEKAMDRNVVFFLNDPPLDQAVQQLARLGRVDIRLDEASLKKSGIALDTKMPFKMQGSVSLRSALNLLLGAYDLKLEKDDKGLIVTTGKAAPAEGSALSEPQQACAQRIEKVLNNKKSFNLREKSLAEVAQYFERATGENFVLDPAARRTGLLDPKAMISATVTDLPLREGLHKLLEPVGLTIAIRDEVVVIVPKSKPSANSP